ncbi:MAG: nucleoside triphosphate pyrophosphohydrolase [Oscillospiraceae bacterium]|nr:nucleoside triphosphate pyrophosphohydrolase [Oscillospiraceae bacterium]
MVDFENKPNYDIHDLQKLMRFLRSPDGCPWDAEQTHESIRRNLLEEAYEAAEAIDTGNQNNLREELGDVLLQVVFHADISEQAGGFDFSQIVDALCKKLISRHPHVFGDEKANDSTESLAFWEDIKREEKQTETVHEEMRSIAISLPALWRAEKIQKKAAEVGFDWKDYKGALTALRSEIDELEDAMEDATASISDTAEENETDKTNDAFSKVTMELGDIFFSAVNISRFFGIDPEEALTFSSEKFIERFRKVETAALDAGFRLEEMSLDEMEALYQKAKLEE